MLTSWRFCHTSVHSAFVPFAHMERSGVAATSGRIQRRRAKLSQSSRFLTGRLIDELFEQEFCVCCYIPNSIFIQLSNENASSTNKFPHNMVYFTKKTICSGTLTANLVLSETIPTFFLDSICFHLSQCPLDSNGMQCLRHLVSAGLVFAGSVIRLHHQDEP